MYNMLQKWGRNGYRKCTRTRSKNEVTVLTDSKQLINANFVGQTIQLLSFFVCLFRNEPNQYYSFRINPVISVYWVLNFELFLCSTDVPESARFCSFFGTDRYVLLGSFWLTRVGWVKPPAVLEEANSAIGLLDINQSIRYGFSKRLWWDTRAGDGSSSHHMAVPGQQPGDEPLCQEHRVEGREVNMGLWYHIWSANYASYG